MQNHGFCLTRYEINDTISIVEQSPRKMFCSTIEKGY